MVNPEIPQVEFVTAYLSLGSNLGDKQENIRAALRILGDKPGITLAKYSSIYLTEAIGVTRQLDFYNAVARIQTSLSPQELLRTTQSIQDELGRQPESHHQPRPIDIDILFYGDMEINSPDLIIPHSRLTRRAFVLIPLLEISPNLIHPVTFRPLEEYLAQIYPPQKVERIIDAGKLFESAAGS